MKLTMLPASSATLARGAPMTQVFRVENTAWGAKPLALRVKLAYTAGAEPVVEQVDVKAFPPGF